MVSEAYKVFNDLLGTKRGLNVSMKGFELRFSANVAKFNAISASTKLPDCLTALMLISNSDISDSQRVSVLAAAASSSAVEDVATATNEQFLKSISYSAVASVVKQCEGKRVQEDDYLKGNNCFATNRFNENNKFKNRNKFTREQYEKRIMKSPCAICGKFGHWKNEHLKDGSLPPDVKSVDKPSSNEANFASSKNGTKKTVSFSNARLTSSRCEVSTFEKSELPNVNYVVSNSNEVSNLENDCSCNITEDDQCKFCNDWSLPDSTNT